MLLILISLAAIGVIVLAERSVEHLLFAFRCRGGGPRHGRPGVFFVLTQGLIRPAGHEMLTSTTRCRFIRPKL